jgi:uncharacterized protein
MSPHLVIDRGAVKAFCERHHVARLALFGSAIREDFDADSDVDVLVEFQLDHVPGLSFIGMEREWSGLLQGRRVDLDVRGLPRDAYDADEHLRLAPAGGCQPTPAEEGFSSCRGG